MDTPTWTFTINPDAIFQYLTYICTTAFTVSTFVTNFFDTPDTPGDDDGTFYKVWYHVYKLMEIIRCINQKAKQRPNLAWDLKELANQAKAGNVDTQKLITAIEDTAHVLGNKRVRDNNPESST
jgi:hypothetical protein